MRQIKFRAWDKQERKYATDIVVGAILYEVQANPKADVLESFVLEQQLKENLWEGDRVRFHYKSGFIAADLEGEIRYNEKSCCFGIHCEALLVPFVLITQVESLVVIGNIHEGVKK